MPNALPALTPAEREHFARLFKSEMRYLWNVLRRLGVPAADLPDLVHDVFLTVVRQWASYDAHRELHPWMFGIAFRVVANHRRLARHGHELLEHEKVSEAPATAPLADELLIRRENLALLEEALQALPLERRAVIVLHDFDEQPMPEIAGALDIPLNTAYSRLRIARTELIAAVARLQSRKGAR